jgi:hypothetical protein
MSMSRFIAAAKRLILIGLVSPIDFDSINPILSACLL